MKIFLITSLLFVSLAAWTGTSMKLEGSCKGVLKDGTNISFEYYSNFNGCTPKALAAINYTSGMEGVVTGVRNFTEFFDTYRFNSVRLIFKNATGNDSGIYKYRDAESENQSIKVQCDIRDYEYGEC